MSPGPLYGPRIRRRPLASCLGAALLWAFIVPWASAQDAPAPEAATSWTFVSIPDFLNFDIDDPQPEWDHALDYVLGAIAAEEPEFVLVPGDLVMGHWHLDDQGVEPWASRYYGAWKRRMESHSLRFYTALGDHEIGDNYWRPQVEAHKLALVPDYKRAFEKHLSMPANGPSGHRGTAFWWRHGQVLFVSLDLFLPDPKRGIAIRAGEEQLAWLDEVMAQHQDATFRIVMAHPPILSPVWKRSSSGLFVDGGADSPLWGALERHGVDLYLCGEVHAITSTHRGGVEQIVHGSLFGFFNPVNYLVVTVTPGRLDLELKEIDTYARGKRLWQTGTIRPREQVRIRRDAQREGFRVVGSMALEVRQDGKHFVERTGHFTDAFQPPTDTGKKAVRLPKRESSTKDNRP